MIFNNYEKRWILYNSSQRFRPLTGIMILNKEDIDITKRLVEAAFRPLTGIMILNMVKMRYEMKRFQVLSVPLRGL